VLAWVAEATRSTASDRLGRLPCSRSRSRSGTRRRSTIPSRRAAPGDQRAERARGRSRLAAHRLVLAAAPRSPTTPSSSPSARDAAPSSGWQGALRLCRLAGILSLRLDTASRRPGRRHRLRPLLAVRLVEAGGVCAGSASPSSARPDRLQR
jgi:hypothetical protein